MTEKFQSIDKVASGSYLVPMRKVGLKALKNELSKYVRIAAKGETVLVTDRDRVVAELIPPRCPPDASTAEAKWAEMVRQGIITPAPNPKGPLPKRTPIMTLEELLRELDEDRADRDLP
jgi:antitoxin (DNA-binding transcriptional repressor) of toxin-antitoxin stability system